MDTVHLFGRMNSDDADKDLTNKEVRRIENLMPVKRSNGIRRELLRGNADITGNVTLQEGAVVIGAFESTEKNELYLFVKEPIDYVVKVYESGGVLTSVNLTPATMVDFSNVDHIYNVSIINNKLHWCQSDGNQYIIDTEKYDDIEFTSYLDADNKPKIIALQKSTPIIPVVVNDVNTGEDTATKSREYLEDKSLKFTYRYIYVDDDISTFAPWSTSFPAFRIKKDAINNNLDSAIYDDAIDEYKLNPRFYELSIDKDLVPGNVKAIEFAYIDQDNSFSLFSRKERKDDWVTYLESNNKIVAEYKGTELKEPVPLSESLKIQQPNPINPDTATVFQNRVFQSGGDVGLPFDDSNTTLSSSLVISNNIRETYSKNGVSKLWARKPMLKAGGKYKVGIQFFDSNFKRSFVHNVKEVSVPKLSSYTGTTRADLQLRAFGNYPEWAKYYQFVRSDITNLVSYTTVKSVLLPYISEFTEGTEINADEFVWEDRIYKASATPPVDEFNYTHILLPQNIPFELDNTYKIRFFNSSSFDEYPILEIIGDIAVIEKVPKTYGDFVFEIEIFKENFEDTQIMNEVGDVHPIEDWNTTFEIPGDTYVVYSDYSNGGQLVFDDFAPVEGTGQFTKDVGQRLFEASGDFATASQTTSLRQNTDVQTRLETEAEQTGEEFRLQNVTAEEWGLQLLGPIGAAINIINDAGVEPIFKNRITQKYANMVVNYRLAISSLGRPNFVYKNERNVKLNNTIYYSDPFVQGSKVNGLSNFQGNNNYNLPSNRGPIVSLVPIPSSKVMLALHPRKTSTLYIGEGFIRQGDNSILAKTEGVIGDDRPLQGDYGTVNPESVCVYNGAAIWWDQNKREIVRYNNNGLTPLGYSYRMRDYLAEWGDLLEGSGKPVISGYDPYYECFLIKFPEIGGRGSETLCFSNVDTREGFIGVINHEADVFTILRDNLISVKGDKLYQSTESDTFYGASKPTAKVEFVHNDNPILTKIYENIAINSDQPWLVEVSNDRGQLTDMIEGDFRLYEDTYYSEILRDKNTPDDQIEAGRIKLRDGNLIKGQYSNVKLESDTAKTLNEVVITTQPANGQYK